MIPRKIQTGEPFSNLKQLWDQLIDHLHETRLVPGAGLRLTRRPAGTLLEATALSGGAAPPAPAAAEEAGYTGYFKVIWANAEGSELKVVDGADPEGAACGYTDVADTGVPVAEVSAGGGGSKHYVVLCLEYQANGDGTGSYTHVLKVMNSTGAHAESFAGTVLADFSVSNHTIRQIWTGGKIYWRSRFYV